VWVILAQLVPLWRAEAARRQDEKETQRVQEELVAANVPDTGVAQTLLRHVNHRISAQLKSAYPDVRWEWIVKNPALLAVQGGIGRIRVYGIPDFDFADVELDQRANLSCAIISGVLHVPDLPAILQDCAFLAMYGDHQILGEPVLYHICLVFAIVPKSYGNFLRSV